jgi:hypothetical protein
MGAEPCHDRVDAIVALKHATYSGFIVSPPGGRTRRGQSPQQTMLALVVAFSTFAREAEAALLADSNCRYLTAQYCYPYSCKWEYGT